MEPLRRGPEEASKRFQARHTVPPPERPVEPYTPPGVPARKRFEREQMGV